MSTWNAFQNFKANSNNCIPVAIKWKLPRKYQTIQIWSNTHKYATEMFLYYYLWNVREDYGDWSLKQTDEDYCLNKTFDAVLNQRILYCEWFQVLWMVFFFYQFCIVHQGNILGKAFQFIANFWERQMVERHNPPFLGSELPNSQPYTNNRKIPHFWWFFWSWFFLITASIKDKHR